MKTTKFLNVESLGKMSYPNRNWIIEDQRLSVEFAAGMIEFMAMVRQHVNGE